MMKGQKGQAIILVLVLLAIGSLTITPFLRLVASGLLGQGRSEIATALHYGGAVDDALWRLLNGLMGDLNQSNPSIGYDFTFGTYRFPVQVQVPSVPPSQQLAVGSIKYLTLEVSPNFVTGSASGYTTNYIVRSQTQPWSNNPSTWEVTLPKGLTYTDNSTWYRGPDPQNSLDPAASVNFASHQVLNKSGNWVPMAIGAGLNTKEVTQEPSPYLPNTSYVIKTTLPSGQQHLKFFVIPAASGGNRSYIMTYQVTGKPPGGINYAQFSYDNAGYTGTNIQTAALGVAYYTVTIPINGVTYKVIVAYDSTTDTMKIVSFSPA